MTLLGKGHMSVDPTFPAPQQPVAGPQGSYPGATPEPYYGSTPQQAAPASASSDPFEHNYDNAATTTPHATVSGYEPPVGDGTQENWKGIVAIIAAIVFPLAGIVFGHMALGAAKRGTADNKVLSIAALVLSYLAVVGGFIIGIVMFVLLYVTGNTV